MFFQRQRKPGKEIRNIVGDRKYVFFVEGKINSRGKEGKYLEKENIFLQRRRITEKEKEDHLQKADPSRKSFANGWSILMIICKRPVC